MLEARQRWSIDGRVWYCAYDPDRGKYSTLLCFGKYKTKRSCEAAIKFQADKAKTAAIEGGAAV